MTDLEKHVYQPGRAKLVKQVRANIYELGIIYIFFHFMLQVLRGILNIFSPTYDKFGFC